MGFDICMLQYPETLAEGYEPQDPEEPEYWRFAGRGMSVMLNIMTNLDVIDEELPRQVFPSWPPAGIDKPRAYLLQDWDRTGAGDPHPTQDELFLLARWKAEQTRVQSGRSPRPNRVPWYKFASNDGWLVDPEEAKLLASAMRLGVSRPSFIAAIAKHVQDSPEEIMLWMQNWGAFNATAAAAGGYRVT